MHLRLYEEESNDLMISFCGLESLPRSSSSSNGDVPVLLSYIVIDVAETQSPSRLSAVPKFSPGNVAAID